ncbi:cyclase [Streptomyces umbrinus]|uniref:MBL fold metallo-hydrolase n=1 Tax=Streptomyces umbrinus TaxID=67370 RepID=UPI0019B9E933|nr:MBL fold metallo-hydrolase [Streptomyces umbrinus]MCR3729925.1 cyclase [Streptomyces umbrinus]GHH40043.1 MBL fold metallo-hydrolase [Streptomyces umbrinus]
MSGRTVNGARTAAPGRLEELADGVFAYIQPDGGWCVSNAGILLEPGRGGGPVLVDTAATHERARAMRTALGGLTPESPRLIVNTHFHGDHTFGNAVLAGPGTVVVAHERTRSEMAAAGLGLTGLWPDVEWGGIELMLPDLTYRQGLTLHQGERRIELIHPGPAHTTNDTLVWLPEERVLFAGDVVLPGCTPFVLMGSVAGSLATLELLRKLDPLTVVGGHGPVSGPEALTRTEEYFHWLTELAAEGRAAGLTPLQLARERGPGPYGDLRDPERLPANLHRAYSELAGEELGHALDVVSVFGEMVEYNGGVLPVSHA